MLLTSLCKIQNCQAKQTLAAVVVIIQIDTVVFCANLVLTLIQSQSMPVNQPRSPLQLLFLMYPTHTSKSKRQLITPRATPTLNQFIF